MDYRDIVSHKNRWYESLDERAMVAHVEFDIDDFEDMSDEEFDDFVEKYSDVPVVWAVCPTCGGRGQYVNPSIDSHGISAEEWGDWDDEERISYFRGNYNIPCAECGGRRVIPVPDTTRCDRRVLDAIKQKMRFEADYAREIAHERERGY